MQQTPVEKRRCHGCGAPLLRFTTRHGLLVDLDDAPLPIITDLRALRDAGRMVWTFTPGSGRWSFKNGFDRDWREVRVEHDCASTSLMRKRTST